MSARDKKRDFGAGPNGTLRDVQHAGDEPDDKAETQETAAAAASPEHTDPDEEKTGARKKFDPYRFQANTVPPGMRAELLQAEPEEHPSELMQDTLPPNRSAPRAVRSVASELGDSGVHRAVAPRPGLRPAALVSLSLAAIALAVLVVVAATRPRYRYEGAASGAPATNVVDSAPKTAATPSVVGTAPSVAGAAPNGAGTAPSVVGTAPSVAGAAPNGAGTAPNSATARGATRAPSAAAVPSGASAPKERRVTPVAPRETTPPPKMAGPKSETPAHGSRPRQHVDLESPLMP